MRSSLSLIYAVIAFIAVYMLSVCQLYILTQDDNEYCQWETFNASCSSSMHPDHVIMMTSARYGRMRFGRCMREDHGSVGCSADVLAHLDRLCTGRRQCFMAIPDATLHANHPCPKELMPYLEASYTCVRLSGTNRQSCALYGGQLLKGESGYLMPGGHLHSGSGGSQHQLASSSAGQPNQTPFLGPAPGTAGCPWLLRAKPGQRINLTLYNLDREVGIQSQATKCAVQRLVVHDRNKTLEGAVCNDKRRERHLYTSEGSEVNIYVQHSSSRTSQTADSQHGAPTPAFVIKYQVIGCPDIVVNDNLAWVRRQGDTAIVRCNFTGETFYVTCLDTEWKGEVSACTRVIPTSSGQKVDKAPSFTQGILVVIGIGVALGVAIGVIVLFSVLFCIRRLKGEDNTRYQVNARLLASGAVGSHYDTGKYGGGGLTAQTGYGTETSAATVKSTPEHQVIQLADLCPYHQQIHSGLTLPLPVSSSESADVTNIASLVANSLDDLTAGDGSNSAYRLYSSQTWNNADVDSSTPPATSATLYGRRTRLNETNRTTPTRVVVGERSTASSSAQILPANTRRSLVTFKPLLNRTVTEGSNGSGSRDGSQTALVQTGSCTSLDLIKHFQQRQQLHQLSTSREPEVQLPENDVIRENDRLTVLESKGIVEPFVTSTDA